MAESSLEHVLKPEQEIRQNGSRERIFCRVPFYVYMVIIVVKAMISNAPMQRRVFPYIKEKVENESRDIK